MKKLISCLLVAGLCLGLAACSEKETQEEYTLVMDAVTINPVVKEADPVTAIEEIYDGNDTEGLEDATDRILSDKFFISPDHVREYYVRYSNGRFGVADVFILLPKKEYAASVRESLESVKLSRMQEFENYDVYNAYQIAQEAQIFEQGGYVILLMLENNEVARNTIDRYIPKS